jgi:hypothetical protein
MNVECDKGLVGPQGGQAGLASHVPNLSKGNTYLANVKGITVRFIALQESR